MKLVWHARRIRVGRWIRSLLGDLVTEEVEDLDDANLDSDSIHVVSINTKPLAAYDAYFRRLRENARNITLFHTGDEWYSGGYAAYGYFDKVLRNYHTRLADHPGVMTLPLGYPNTTEPPAALPPASARRYLWSFAGQIKASRIEMEAALRPLQPAFLTDTRGAPAKALDKAGYNALLADSVFVPCPMGNVNLESWRLYEALSLGAIPILERRLTLDYFGRLFGPNPLPSFANWPEACRWCRDAAADPQRLDAVQAEVADWWGTTQAGLGAELRAFLAGPSQADQLTRFAGLLRNRARPVHEALRLAELARHQTAASLGRRLAQPAGALRRMREEAGTLRR